MIKEYPHLWFLGFIGMIMASLVILALSATHPRIGSPTPESRITCIEDRITKIELDLKNLRESQEKK